MAIYFSKSTNGFYDSEINTTIPDDVVEISKEQHQSLLKEQADGKQIKADSSGNPIAVVVPTNEEELRQGCKAKAINLLTETDWTQVSDCPLKNKEEFSNYRNLIRQLALNPVANPTFPEKPSEQW